MAELNSTNVEELRQWFEAKEAFVEAEELREKKEEEMRMEVQALTPKSKSFWIGVIDPNSPVEEGSGLTKVKDEVPLLSCHCFAWQLRKGF